MSCVLQERRKYPRFAVSNGVISFADGNPDTPDPRLLDISKEGLAFSSSNPRIFSQNFFHFNLLVTDWTCGRYLFLYQAKGILVAVSDEKGGKPPGENTTRLRYGIKFLALSNDQQRHLDAFLIR